MLTFPNSQRAQALSVDMYRPASHLVQNVARTVDVCATEQLEQLDSPPRLVYLPAVQSTHSNALFMYCPASHCEQYVRPLLFDVCPLEHVLHAVCLDWSV